MMQETKRNRGYGRALLEAIEDIARHACRAGPCMLSRHAVNGAKLLCHLSYAVKEAMRASAEQDAS